MATPLGAQQYATCPGTPGQLPGGLGGAKAVFNVDVWYHLRPVGSSPFNSAPVVGDQQVRPLLLADLPEGAAVGQACNVLSWQDHLCLAGFD